MAIRLLMYGTFGYFLDHSVSGIPLRTEMISIAFWNFARNSLADLAGRIVREHSVDILCCCECPDDDEAEIEKSLDTYSGKKFKHVASPVGGSKLRLFTHFSKDELLPLHDDESGRLAIFRLILERTDILIAVVHGLSLMHATSQDQHAEAIRIASDIRRIESDLGHRRTIVLGDFNMSPFDHGITSASGFHAIPSAVIANRLQRKVQGIDYPFFYNPMWNCFGDQTPGPPGSFFRQGSEHITHFWYILDQVLLRPELLRLANSQTRILDSVDGNPLYGRTGYPDKGIGSDHFPILCELKLK